MLAGGLLLLLCALLRWQSVASEVWHGADYPHPDEQPVKCRVRNDSHLCDPDALLRDDQRAELTRLIAAEEDEIAAGETKLTNDNCPLVRSVNIYVAIADAIATAADELSDGDVLTFSNYLVINYGLSQRACRNYILLTVIGGDKRLHAKAGDGTLLPRDVTNQLLASQQALTDNDDLFAGLSEMVRSVNDLLLAHVPDEPASQAGVPWWLLLLVCLLLIVVLTILYCCRDDILLCSRKYCCPCLPQFRVRPKAPLIHLDFRRSDITQVFPEGEPTAEPRTLDVANAFTDDMDARAKLRASRALSAQIVTRDQAEKRQSKTAGQNHAEIVMEIKAAESGSDDSADSADETNEPTTPTRTADIIYRQSMAELEQELNAAADRSKTDSPTDSD